MHPDLDSKAASEADPTVRAIRQALRELPCEAQPPFDWREFQHRSGAARARRGPRAGWRELAVAAGLAALVAGVALWGRITPLDAPGAAGPGAAAETQHGATSERAHALASAEAAERWLAQLPRERAIVRVGTHLPVAELEDRLAWVDDVLTTERLAGREPAVRALQRERAELVRSLAQVSYAETLAAELP